MNHNLAYSYFSLAKLLPNDLRLFGSGKSRSLELLLMAAEHLVRSTKVDVSECVSLGADANPLRDAIDGPVTDILDLNHDAISLLRFATRQNDLEIPAIPHFGAESRMAYCYPLVADIRDMQCLLARDCILNRRYDQAQSTTIDIYRLGYMLCRGGGDIGWCGVGVVSSLKALSLIRALMSLEHAPIKLEELLEQLLADDFDSCLSGTLLSDLFRDVIVAFAEMGDISESASGLRAALKTQLLEAISRDFGDHDITADNNVRLRDWVESVVQHFGSLRDVFLARDTLLCLKEIYETFRGRFTTDFRAQMIIPEHISTQIGALPTYLQFPNGSTSLTQHTLFPAEAGATAMRNGLGLLLLCGITRSANAVVKRGLVAPWRLSIERDAVCILLAAKIFKKRTGRYPFSIDEVVGYGLLSGVPVDRITGTQFRFQPDPCRVAGPSLSVLNQTISYPLDAPELKWTMPEVSPQ